MTVPSRNPVSYAAWREEVSPYEVAVNAIPSLIAGRPVFVDGEMRVLVLDGLSKTSPSILVLPAPVEIQRLRQRKSVRELEIMKCANEVSHNCGLHDQPDSDYALERPPFWLSERSKGGCTLASLNPRPALSLSGLSKPPVCQAQKSLCFLEVSL